MAISSPEGKPTHCSIRIHCKTSCFAGLSRASDTPRRLAPVPPPLGCLVSNPVPSQTWLVRVGADPGRGQTRQPLAAVVCVQAQVWMPRPVAWPFKLVRWWSKWAPHALGAASQVHPIVSVAYGSVSVFAGMNQRQLGMGDCLQSFAVSFSSTSGMQYTLQPM